MSAAPPAWVLQRIAALIEARFGLVFGESNRPELARASRELAQKLGLAGPEALAQLLSEEGRGREAADLLVDAVTIGETYFFRGPEQLSWLRAHALPELVGRRRAEGRRSLRAWSAGCSSGEEAYSLAAALTEAVPPGEAWELSVLGTDVNRGLLRRAERAEYSPWSLRGLGPVERARYLLPGDKGGWRVRDELRRLARFAPLNLKEAGYPDLRFGTASIDVLFCRNVFIYFAPEVAAAIAARLAGCLAEGGVLFFGPSDPVPASLPGVEPVRCEATMVYRRAGGPGPIEPPGARRRPGRALPRARPLPRAFRPPLPAGAPHRPPPGHSAGQPAGPEASARLWLSRQPDSALACHCLAMHRRERGDLAAALDYARRAVCLEPSLALGHFSLGELFEATRRDADARGCFAEALELVRTQADDTLLAGSDEITAGWLRRVLAARLAGGGREG